MSKNRVEVEANATKGAHPEGGFFVETLIQSILIDFFAKNEQIKKMTNIQ